MRLVRCDEAKDDIATDHGTHGHHDGLSADHYDDATQR